MGRKQPVHKRWARESARPDQIALRQSDPNLFLRFADHALLRCFTTLSSATRKIPPIWKGDVGCVIAQDHNQGITKKEQQFRAGKRAGLWGMSGYILHVDRLACRPSNAHRFVT